MFWNASGGSVRIEDTDMDYVTFGTGNTPLVMIPGLGHAAYEEAHDFNRRVMHFFGRDR